MDELELLREVARAAAALVEAHYEWEATLPIRKESASYSHDEIVERLDRCAKTNRARLSELTVALDRLAELDR